VRAPEKADPSHVNIGQQEAAGIRQAIVEQVARMFSEWGAGEQETLLAAFGEALARFDRAALEHFLLRLQTTGGDWGYHLPDPVARAISRLGHSLVAREGSSLDDGGGLGAARAGPVVFVGNHLSFIDANTVDFLLQRAGWQDVADNLTVLVGPKVFAEPIRRVASLCFGTIKMPQSTSRASGEAVMSRRETLRLAELTLDHVRARRARGDHLLIFAEGSRSRTGSMQRALAAIARYVEEPYATLVPFAVWGTERMVPVDDERAHPSDVHVRIGRPLDAASLFDRGGRRRSTLSDALGFLIADLLPPAHRGCYASADADLADARALADSL
jgi:1-acyl-sn-glycerol-3-phosphate acyltransferase